MEGGERWAEGGGGRGGKRGEGEGKLGVHYLEVGLLLIS